MEIKKIIKFFYFIYTIYIMMVINTTSLLFYDILPALIILWINYYVFNLGYISYKKKPNDIFIESRAWLLQRRKIVRVGIAFFSVIFSVATVYYYTGQTPVSVIRNLTSNISLYYEYQKYFSEQQRSVFSLVKVPFIFMLFYVKLILFYSYITLLIPKSKLSKFDTIYLCIVTISYLYVGVARGTNFEFFELAVLIIFISLTTQINKKKCQLPIKAISKVVVIISGMIFLFYKVIEARGMNFNYYISSDVFYDPNGSIPMLLPFLSFAVLVIYGYFGFGFYYVSSYVNKIWFESTSNLIAGFMPVGYKAIGNYDIQSIMRNTIDMGARWHPDLISIIGNFGYFGLLLFCFILGIFAKHIHIVNKRSSIIYFTSFIILIQMISLPVGNFISSSSSSQLIVLSLMVYWIWKTSTKKIKLKY